MRRFRSVQRTLRWLADEGGWPGVKLLLGTTALFTWVVLWVAGWRGPEPGTWAYAAIVVGLGMLALVALLQSRRERERLELMQQEARRESANAEAEARALAAEADRLLPRAREGYAQRQKTRGGRI